MTSKEYLEQSARTAHTPCFLQLPLTSDGERQFVSELMHAAMGMVTESGEFVDALKKHAIYGKQLDVTNLVEELGDLAWYLALACRTLGVTLEEIFDRNIAKLKHRYPDKFNAEQALNRDLDGERAVLERKNP